MDPCLCLSIWNHWQASRWMTFPLFLPLNKHVARRSRIQVQLLCTLHLAMQEAAIYDQYCSLPPGARRNGNVLIPLLQSSVVVPIKKNNKKLHTVRGLVSCSYCNHNLQTMTADADIGAIKNESHTITNSWKCPYGMPNEYSVLSPTSSTLCNGNYQIKGE